MSLALDIDVFLTAIIIALYAIVLFMAVDVRKYAGGVPGFWKLMILAVALLAAHSIGYALADIGGTAGSDLVIVLDDITHVALALVILLSVFKLRALWTDQRMRRLPSEAVEEGQVAN